MVDVRFVLPAATATLRAQLCTAMLSHLITDDLNELAYEAELAGTRPLRMALV